MQDNELIASFEPRLAGYVLVLAFDNIEDMLLEQERIMAKFRQDRDEEGRALPQVETLWMGQSQYGERQMMAGQIRVGALVASEAGLKETELSRRGWAQAQMQKSSALPAKRGLSQGWHPTTDQMDMLNEWAERCIEVDPAGSAEWTKRVKVSVARRGYNEWCLDKERPDLQLTGPVGGKAFSAAMQTMFNGSAVTRISEGGHPYLHGLKRKDGANPRYFRRS